MRKVYAFFLIFLITILLISCSSSGSTNPDSNLNTNQNENTVNKVDDTKDNNVGQDKQNVGPLSKIQKINFNEDFGLDFAEFSLANASTTKLINPTDTSGVYSYFEAEAGETFFYILGNIKNTSGNSFSVEDMTINVEFDGKYNYSAWVAADDGGNDFYGDYIAPFKSVKVYLISTIPDELIKSYKNVKVTIGIMDDFGRNWSNVINEPDEFDHIYEISIKK